MDTIANVLTIIRNAELAGHASAPVPFSNVTSNLLGLLQEHGYIASFQREAGVITVALKQGSRHSYKRVSKPGRRMYVGADSIPSILGGRGLAVISTSSGLLSGKEAKKRGIGGELMCEVY